ncbi:3708_t:CDS:2, partial [Dentiscutata heterogama]
EEQYEAKSHQAYNTWDKTAARTKLPQGQNCLKGKTASRSTDWVGNRIATTDQQEEFLKPATTMITKNFIV